MEGGQLTKTILDPKNIYEEKVSNNLSIKKVALADVRRFGNRIQISNYDSLLLT